MSPTGYKIRDARIAELEAQVAELQQQPLLAAFAARLGDGIMTCLANTPYERWPELAQIVWKHESLKSHTIARIYKDRLPN